uniref:Uncharacterized protein n=1 Tax=Ditylenchus dipsaci TaxID=166011 RepID=A0A915ENP6_9BILA
MQHDREQWVCASNETQVRVISVAEVASIGKVGISRFRGKKGSNSPPPLEKRDSRMNLIPQELHKHWFESDESKFEREKHLLVLCPNADPTKASRVVIVDVDYQSRNYGKVVSYLSMPKPGDDLIYACCRRTRSDQERIPLQTASSTETR